MKSLFKCSLLTAAVALTLNASSVFAADAKTDKPADAVKVSSAFKNLDQQTAYSLGASLGKYMSSTVEQQAKLGINLDKTQLLAGVQDAFDGKSKLSDQDVQQTLKSFEGRVQAAAQAKADEEAKANESKGVQFRDKYAKEQGVEKTADGLLYKVERAGSGASPKDSDTVVVNYKGTLIDGKEFDSSYSRGQPLTFRLDGVIPGWTEGLKKIKKGGKIHMVIPPELAYGKSGVPGIAPNSTLVFDVELLDINPKPAASAAKPNGKAESKKK